MDTNASANGVPTSVPSKGALSAAAAAFLKRVSPAAEKPAAASPKKRLWARPKGANRSGPRGKVPPNMRGVSRDIAARKERAEKRVAKEIHDPVSWVRRSPAWAFSLALHLLAAVILMNVVYFKPHQRLGQIFRVALRIGSPGGLEEGPQDNGVKGKDSEDSPPKEIADTGQPETGPLRLPPVTSTAGPSPLPIGVTGEPTGEAGFSGIYAGRGGAGRGNALRRYGGDGVSEQAVSDGLAWLADHQSADGSWDLASYTRRCPAGQKCADEREEYWSHQYDAYKCAATGLAALAFLGAGYTQMDDQRTEVSGQEKPPRHPFCDVVDRALQYLCKAQRPDGCLISGDRESERSTVSHGMAGIALIEAYSLTHDPRLRPHAQLAVNHTCMVQQDNGGWDYGNYRSGRGDTNVASWQVMLLRSARAAGLAVPKKTWEMAKVYMESVTDRKTGAIAYELEGARQVKQEGCNAIVAAGWVTRIYLGIADDHPTQEQFAQVIRKVPPRFDNEWGACAHWSMLAARKAAGHWSLYYNYYATLAMFHHGGEDWEKWNAKIREVTLGAQRKDGHEKGSWDPVTADSSFGGRVYATAMCVINLEVYYRYLPIYEVGADFGLAPLTADADWVAIRDNAVKGTFHVRKKQPVAEPTPADAVSATEALISDLKSADMMTRRNAARELSQKAVKEAIPALIQAASIEKTSLRPVLVEYLGGFGPEPAILDALIGLLQDGSDRIRKSAADGLKKATGEDFGAHYLDWQKWREDKVRK
ncbi:MAG: HEAT repeat domain-containing protein [Planctomycetota bacterium]|mgnify:CR=1 FL=1